MIIFPNGWIQYFNWLLVLWFLIVLYFGYQKGLVMQVVDLASTFVAAFAAWIFAPVFVKLYQFVAQSGNGFISVNQLISYQINVLIWFVILFIVFRLLLILIKPLAAVISRVPVIRHVNSAAGGVFSIVVFAVHMFILCFVLSTPLVKNGQVLLEQTWLKTYQKHVVSVSETIDGYLAKNEALQAVVVNRKFNDKEIAALAKWLSEHGFNEKEIREFVGKYE